jgi:hypothetical protein
MNKRDIITISLTLIWSGVCLFFTNIFGDSLTSSEIIAIFAFTLLMLCVSLILLIILSMTIKRFGKWGDQKIINKRKIAHRRWQRRWNRAWNIACNKAYGLYSEDINACHPDFYFWNEYYGLRGKYPKGYEH